MRSPNPGNANNVRNVNTDGSLNNNNAINGNGAVADCENRELKVIDKVINEIKALTQGEADLLLGKEELSRRRRRPAGRAAISSGPE